MRDETVESLAAEVNSGDCLALGGKTIHRAPMAFIRALARRSVDDLATIGLAKSIDVDLLCATDQLSDVYYGYVGLEWLGLAPAFRRAAESGTIRIHEGSCYTVATMLRGAAQGVPSLPVAGMEGSDLPKADPSVFVEDDSPMTGETVRTVRTVRPDIGVVHAAVADRDGNARLYGGDLTEGLVARASETVFVTAERIVDSLPDRPTDGPAAEIGSIDLPGALVDAVAAAPHGAHPTSCPGVYEYDRDFLDRYRTVGAEGAIDREWASVVGESPADYRDRAIADPDGLAWDADRAGGRVTPTGAHDPVPDRAATVAEVMCLALARRLIDSDVRTVFQGFASPLPTVAIRAARERDPDLVHLSASGAINGTPGTMPTSTEDQHLFEGADGRLGSPGCFDMAARGELDVMFVGSPQIDRRGRLNGTAVGPLESPTVKFPGAGGTASLLPLIGAGYAWRTEHSTRTLPESVDFVTADGNLSVLVTPLCTFERRDDELVVIALHPGVDRATVDARTGWDVTFESTATTPVPTAEELALLDAVDPSRTRRTGFDADQLEQIASSTPS